MGGRGSKMTRIALFDSGPSLIAATCNRAHVSVPKMTRIASLYLGPIKLNEQAILPIICHADLRQTAIRRSQGKVNTIVLSINFLFFLLPMQLVSLPLLLRR
jgi:hypothetical protein